MTRQRIPIFFSESDRRRRRRCPTNATQSCLGVSWLFMSTLIQPPTVPWASPSTQQTSDSGSNQKPRGLWPNSHPPDHVGDVFSSQMCIYIPQNVPKPPRNRNLKNQNFDPVRIRTQVCWVIYGDHTTRPLVHIYELQKWVYKLDLTSSCQSYKFPVLEQNSDNWFT